MCITACVSRPRSLDRWLLCLWQRQEKLDVSRTCFNGQCELRTHWRHYATTDIPHRTSYWSDRYINRRTLTNQSSRFSTNQSKDSPTNERTGPPWRVLFFGSDEFSIRCLRKLKEDLHRPESTTRAVEKLEVVCAPKRVPVREYADEHHLPVNDWPLKGTCDRFDVGVVASFGFLIPKRVIRLFPYGILNIHPSLLPRWRGASPVFHTILHGDQVTGVTVIHITPNCEIQHKKVWSYPNFQLVSSSLYQGMRNGFDVGPILQQETTPVPHRCQAMELGSRLFDKGADMLMQCLRDLPRKIEHAVDQPTTGATNAPKLSPDQSWVRWAEQSCQEIDRLCRSVGQKLPLRSMWNGRTVKLVDIVDPAITKGLSIPVTAPTPGSAHFHKVTSTVCIRCKDGWVGFRTVVLKKKLTAQEFYNGYLSRDHLKGELFQSGSPGSS